MGNPKILYLSYDGALEPLGESQILPYLRGLVSLGATITLISFEKRADRESPGRVQNLKVELLAQGIRWIPLTYHRRPVIPATLFDLLVGMVRAGAVVRKNRVQVVHSRSYVPALMAWFLGWILGVKFIFDMRGFWADERVEGGLWSSGGFLYRLVKWLECRFLRDADEIVTLTEKARLTIKRLPGIEASSVTVIPTCVDLARFPVPVRSRSPNSSPVFTYAGSVGTWYLLGEMLRFVKEAINRFSSTRFLLFTRNCEEAARELQNERLSPDVVTITSITPAEVPTSLARADAGLAFYKPGWSRQATCPTKIGEYLAMGLPVVVNDAVGDMKDVIGSNRVGVVLSDFSTEAYSQALDQLNELWTDPNLASRCRGLAETYFSLQLGVNRYWEIYQRLV